MANIVSTALRVQRSVIHHARTPSDVIATRIISGGERRLEPPGIALIVAELPRFSLEGDDHVRVTADGQRLLAFVQLHRERGHVLRRTWRSRIKLP